MCGICRRFAIWILATDVVGVGLGLVCCFGLVGLLRAAGFVLGWLVRSFGGPAEVGCCRGCGTRFLVVGFGLAQVFAILVSSVVFGWVLCVVFLFWRLVCLVIWLVSCDFRCGVCVAMILWWFLVLVLCFSGCGW